jgi:hypothetical protein
MSGEYTVGYRRGTGGFLNYRVAAAIDFGTHGSGFAWAVLSGDDERPFDGIDFFDQWTDAPVTYPKNLSALLLAADGTALEWGYAARRAKAGGHGGQLVRGFKMWLRPDEDLDSYPEGADLAGLPARALPLVTAYLGYLRRAAMARIEDGGFLAEDVRWCLTVPAMWDQGQRKLMRRAAERAGFPSDPRQLLLVTEPEAATVYCAQDPRSGVDGTGLLPTLVVDCGGGTVDTASYLIRKDGSLAELGAPAGAKIGSGFINERFKGQILRPRLGAAAYKALVERQTLLLDMTDRFEVAKLEFRASAEDQARIQIPWAVAKVIEPLGGFDALSSAQGGIDDEIRIEAHEMRALFDTTTDALLRLVVTQIRELLSLREVSADRLRLVLVGGFAQSLYVRGRLKERLSEDFGDKVTVVLPPSPARAVLSGAVHYAARPEVVHSRRAALSYGVNVTDVDKPGGILKRPSKRVRQDPVLRAMKPDKEADGSRVRRGLFSPIVVAGESVETGSERRIQYRPPHSHVPALRIELYSSPDKDVRRVDSPGVTLAGWIVVDISESLGEDPDQRKVDVSFYFGGTEIDVVAKNPRTGDRVSTSIEFSGEPDRSGEHGPEDRRDHGD